MLWWISITPCRKKSEGCNSNSFIHAGKNSVFLVPITKYSWDLPFSTINTQKGYSFLQSPLWASRSFQTLSNSSPMTSKALVPCWSLSSLSCLYHWTLFTPFSKFYLSGHCSLRLPHRLLIPLCSFSLVSITDYSVPQPHLKCCVLHSSTLDDLLTMKSHSPLQCGNTQVSICISGHPAEYLDPVLLNTSKSVLYSYLSLTYSRWNSLSSSSFC